MHHARIVVKELSGFKNRCLPAFVMSPFLLLFRTFFFLAWLCTPVEAAVHGKFFFLRSDPSSHGALQW